MKKLFLFAVILTFSLITLNSQDKKNIRIPLIGDTAPSFTAQSTKGQITFPQDYGTSWKILFAHPKDFTPVCSSELLELAQQQKKYKQLGVKVVVLSTDILSQHKDWVMALEQVTYKDRAPEKIEFPLIDDNSYEISNKYGLIHPSVSIEQNIRAVFIIDPTNKIRSINFYPMEIGRNMDEVMRSVIALQTADTNKNIVMPANWNPGEKVMVPVLSNSEMKQLGKPESEIHQLNWFMNFKVLE